ncbi:MAG TPA: hypothetical protein PLD33_06980 [Anaerolineales bacterium]|nr:hypothetical protein [Anaerolineales bacterium]
MRYGSMYRMLFVLLCFSMLSLACNAVTEAMSTPPPVVPTVFTGGQESQPSATQEAESVPEPQATEAGEIPFGIIGTAPEDIPILPDASEMMASPNSVMYTTQLSKDEASQFYVTEMKKLGWSLTPNASINGDVANILSFTMDGKTASIIIGTATGKVKVQVVISEN